MGVLDGNRLFILAQMGIKTFDDENVGVCSLRNARQQSTVEPDFGDHAIK